MLCDESRQMWGGIATQLFVIFFLSPPGGPGGVWGWPGVGVLRYPGTVPACNLHGATLTMIFELPDRKIKPYGAAQ